jgi:hypothetical protein
MSTTGESKRVKVLSIGEEKTFGSNGFRKRELIGKEDGEYGQELCFEFPNDKGDLLDAVLPDSYVTVSYNIRSRKHEVKGKDTQYYTSLSAWKVEV